MDKGEQPVAFGDFLTWLREAPDRSDLLSALRSLRETEFSDFIKTLDDLPSWP